MQVARSTWANPFSWYGYEKQATYVCFCYFYAPRRIKALNPVAFHFAWHQVGRVWRKNFESSICHAKCWWKFVVIITISDRSFFERVLNRRFPEKIDAKSLFSILVIVIWCQSMQKKRWQNHSLLPPLVRKITNLHRNRKNRKTKNMAPF